MQDKIQKALDGLKDFQRKTVDYVFEQLYVKGRSKMLIADEVGLGKTIVAKGLIARAFERYIQNEGPTKGNPTFNVVYICSNLALAEQNIGKLNFTEEDKYVEKTINRLTYLAYKPQGKPLIFKITSLTPGTSFNDKSNQGEADERAIIFCLLAEYSPFQARRNGLRWILKGGIRSIEKWDEKISYFWTHRYDLIRADIFSRFRNELFNTPITQESHPIIYKYLNSPLNHSMWHALLKISANVDGRNIHKFNFIGEITRHLRRTLSRLNLEYLNADIFILDEFQRYSNLIKVDEVAENPAIELARTVFSIKDSKVLMLSATPFKPYTNDFDELNGEIHYKEFQSVLKFLLQDKSEKFWQQYQQDRGALFAFLRHPDTLGQKMPEAIGLKEKLEGLYRNVIVRTERLLASEDRDALVKQVKHKPLTILPEDINDFVTLDQITQLLNKEYKASLPIPLEYVKSSPYALSFLDNYQHKEKIRKLALKNNRLQRLLKQTRHAWLNLEDINLYKPLIPSRGKTLPNAKLRLLLDETIHNNGWKYLWIPPSIPYYELSGAFSGSWGYSKTLIFSSWKMVPRMVASLVSYEAERLSIGNPNSISEKEKIEDKRYYFQKRRSPRPQFTFKVEKEAQEPQQMNNFILTYPCLFLSRLYDPANNVMEKKSLSQIRNDLKKNLITEFNKFSLNKDIPGQGDWQKWHWLAPLALDKATDSNNIISAWFDKGIPPSELAIDAENTHTDSDENSGKGKHFSHAAKAFSKNTLIAGKLTDNQLDKICGHLADLSLGSPAICCLRSLMRHKELSSELLDASYNIASAFLTMFNKPESIAVVRLQSSDGEYWQRALQYMIQGNIQAVIDEFIYLLIDCENIQSPTKLSDHISDLLSVRTATAETEDLKTFLGNLGKVKQKRKSIRSHYAVDFSGQKLNTAKGAGRQINVRQAFNSPFRPFVLATTSIGQEGLDFHLYCKKIFHWNLPSNPIDFEQREGRINRYKGLVIRLNLADKYKSAFSYIRNGRNVWKELFSIASNEKKQAKFPCDLIPFWHTETKSGIKIERFVPLYPFSRDQEKFKNLIKILAYYRLTFGQPRQEELIEALTEKGFSESEIKRIETLLINLSPMCFFKHSDGYTNLTNLRN